MRPEIYMWKHDEPLLQLYTFSKKLKTHFVHIAKSTLRHSLNLNVLIVLLPQLQSRWIFAPLTEKSFPHLSL